MDQAKGPSITIALGASESNVIKSREVFSDAVGLMLYAPAALDVHTYKIQVTDDPDISVPVWRDLEDDTATVIAPPGAGRARAFYNLALARGFKIVDSTGTASVAYTWACTKLYREE